MHLWRLEDQDDRNQVNDKDYTGLSEKEHYVQGYHDTLERRGGIQTHD